MANKLNRIIFTLRDGEDFIPLISLLKACDVVYSGSEAQEVVTNGMVLRNGEVEYRKRAKIRAGRPSFSKTTRSSWITLGNDSSCHSIYCIIKTVNK